MIFCRLSFILVKIPSFLLSTVSTLYQAAMAGCRSSPLFTSSSSSNNIRSLLSSSKLRLLCCTSRSFGLFWSMSSRLSGEWAPSSVLWGGFPHVHPCSTLIHLPGMDGWMLAAAVLEAGSQRRAVVVVPQLKLRMPLWAHILYRVINIR